MDREVRPACLGTKAGWQDGAADRERTARNGQAAASVRAAAPALLVSETIRPETTNQVATDELTADQVPAVHGLICRPVLEAQVATVAPAHNAILDSAVPAGQFGSAVGEALGLAGVDAPECVMALDRADSPGVLGRADRVVSAPTVSVAVRGVMALPTGGWVSVRAMVAGQIVGLDGVGALDRRAASQASGLVVLAPLTWVPAEISVVGAALAAPTLTARGGVAPADRDPGSLALMVHAVSAVGRGATAAVAVLRAVSVATAALVLTGREVSAVAGLMVLQVLAAV